MINKEWKMSKGTVSSAQVDEFISKMTSYIEKQAREEFGHDDDNDIPIFIVLLNRIKHQNIPQLLIERRDVVETDYEKMERLYAISLNVGEAFDNLEVELKIMRRKELNKRDEDNNG